jgi:hypothetical protein
MEAMKVYHLGYSSPNSEQLLQSLMRNPKMLIIDTRKSPKSWRPGWHKDDTEKAGLLIPGLLSQWGDRYRWAGETLGNKNYWRDGAPIDIVDLKRGINGLLYYLMRGYSLILLCECNGPWCHRYVIMAALKRAMPQVQFYRADGTPEEIDTTPEKMYKCFSIRPPSAQWIVSREKFLAAGFPPKCIENREWTTRYRGPVLLHSSKTFEWDVLCEWINRIPGLEEIVPSTEEGYEKGAIVGIADLVDVVTESDDTWFCGSYGWVFANARPLLAPVPFRGALKLFDVPAHVVQHVLPEPVLA